MESEYWRRIEEFWEEINIYDGAEVFLATYRSVPFEAGLLFAAQFCQSEVCNGGFKQFFFNSTGVLAPEAVAGFRAIGQHQTGEVVGGAMKLLGSPYPRDRADRQARLVNLIATTFDVLDDRFYALIGTEAGGFEAASDAYAVKHK